MGTGPAYDAGFTFEVWHQSVIWIHAELGSSPLDAATNCAARCITGGVPVALPATSYLQFMDSRCRAVGSGWYMEGGNNEVQYNVDAMFGENMTTATVTLVPGLGGAASGIFANVQNGDSVDGVSVRNLGGALITTTNCPNVVGPSVDLATSVAGQGAHNPLAFGQVGMSGPSLKMQVDNARRMFGPHTGRYPNIAAPRHRDLAANQLPDHGPQRVSNSALTTRRPDLSVPTGLQLFWLTCGWRLPSVWGVGPVYRHTEQQWFYRRKRRQWRSRDRALLPRQRTGPNCADPQ